MATNNSGNDQVRESRPRTNNFRKDGKTFSGSGEKREYRPRNNGQGNEERKTAAVIINPIAGMEMADTGRMVSGPVVFAEETIPTKEQITLLKEEMADAKVLIKALTRMPMKKEKYAENLSRKIVSQRNSSLTRWK